MELMKFIQILYVFFVGILVALFLGFGINTFYPGPDSPQDRYLSSPDCSYKDPGSPTDEEIRRCNKKQDDQQIAQEKKWNEYNKKMEKYNQKIAIPLLIGSIIFAAISILTEKKIRIIADGILLGSIFSLFYGLIRVFMGGNSAYSFVAVTLGLILVMYLGYHKFIRHEHSA